MSNRKMVRQNGEPVRPIHIALLIAILIGGVLLRVHELGRTSYWFDEIWSVVCARGHSDANFAYPNGYFDHAPEIASDAATRPWRKILTGFDVTPFFYPATLRLWMNLFGDRDVTGRALSVLLSLLTIVALFDLCRLITSPAVALWACSLCAASPPQVHYAREARAYALLCLLSVLVCDVALRITRASADGRKAPPLHYLLLGLLSAAALYTHFFVGGAIAGIALYAAIKLRGQTRLLMIGVIAAACAAVILQVPVLLNHRREVQMGLDWLDEPRDGLLMRTLLRAASLPALYLIQPINPESILATPSIVFMLVPLLLEKIRPGLLLIGLWSIGTVATVVASDFWLGHGGLAYVRYTLAASPTVFVGFVALADLGGRWTRHALPALVVAGALLAVPQVYFDEFWQKTESRALAQDIRGHLASGDFLAIISRPKMGLYGAGSQYAALDFYAGPFNDSVAVLQEPASDEVRRAIWSHRRVWVVECFYGADATACLGPCKLTPVATTRYHAGRLFYAEPLKQ